MLKPILGRIVVKPIIGEAVSPGGILLPQGAQTKSQMGEIVAIGPGPLAGDRIIPFSEIGLSKGDIVTFPYMAGAAFEHLGVEYRVLMYNEIFAKVEESNISLTNDLPYSQEFGVERDVT